MINITRVGNSVQIERDNITSIHPLGTLITHTNEYSDAIDIKYRASRKTVYSFKYDELTEPTAASAKEAQELLAVLFG